MANNYRQFSFALKLQHHGEAEWCQKELDLLKITEDEDGNLMTDYDWTVFGLTGMKTLGDIIQPPYVWFRDSGESGNVEQIADFVQSYLKKFCPKGYFHMSWADTCSKPRVDEFGGGFCIVTAPKIIWFNESEWVTKNTKKLELRNLP